MHMQSSLQVSINQRLITAAHASSQQLMTAVDASSQQLMTAVDAILHRAYQYLLLYIYITELNF